MNILFNPDIAWTERPTASTACSSAWSPSSRAGSRSRWPSSTWSTSSCTPSVTTGWPLVTSHTMYHDLGAQHDPDKADNPSCTPGDPETNGRYLMSKYSNNGKKHNHEILSPCTKVRGDPGSNIETCIKLFYLDLSFSGAKIWWSDQMLKSIPILAPSWAQGVTVSVHLFVCPLYQAPWRLLKLSFMCSWIILHQADRRSKEN